MNPKYCTNLELSKRLKELGVKVESDFYWVEYSSELKREPKVVNFSSVSPDSIFEGKVLFYPAYHCGELGEMLPKTIDGIVDDYLIQYEIQIFRPTDVRPPNWNIIYYCHHIKDTAIEIGADTLAEAMGLMVCWLIENNHLQVKDLNKGE